jgi:hypothetical protein
VTTHQTDGFDLFRDLAPIVLGFICLEPPNEDIPQQQGYVTFVGVPQAADSTAPVCPSLFRLQSRFIRVSVIVSSPLAMLFHLFLASERRYTTAARYVTFAGVPQAADSTSPVCASSTFPILVLVARRRSFLHRFLGVLYYTSGPHHTRWCALVEAGRDWMHGSYNGRFSTDFMSVSCVS